MALHGVALTGFDEFLRRYEAVVFPLSGSEIVCVCVLFILL